MLYLSEACSGKVWALGRKKILLDRVHERVDMEADLKGNCHLENLGEECKVQVASVQLSKIHLQDLKQSLKVENHLNQKLSLWHRHLVVNNQLVGLLDLQ